MSPTERKIYRRTIDANSFKSNRSSRIFKNYIFKNIVDLSYLETESEIKFVNCRFENEFRIRNSKINTLHFELCDILGGIRARRLKATGDIIITGSKGTDKNKVHNRIDLSASEIDGRIEIENIDVSAPEYPCPDPASLEGENGTKPAPNASEEISDTVEPAEPKKDDDDFIALKLNGAQITGDVFLRNGFVSFGRIEMRNTRIGGFLDCKGARFNAVRDRASSESEDFQGNAAFNGHRLSIRGSAFFCHRETHRHAMDSQTPFVSGELKCLPDGLAIEGHEGAFISKGAIVLTGADIDGELNFSGAILVSGKTDALNANHLTVKESLIWRNVSVCSPKSQSCCIQNHQACQEKASDDREHQPIAKIDLSYSNLGGIDDNLGSWPTRWPDLNLTGLVYNRIDHGPKQLKSRLSWLERASKEPASHETDRSGKVPYAFSPQPFQHFAKVLAEMGFNSDERKVLIKKETLLREHSRDLLYLNFSYNRNSFYTKFSLFLKFNEIFKNITAAVSHLYKTFKYLLLYFLYVLRDFILLHTVSYGHRPMKIWISLFALTLLGSLPALATWRANGFVPTEFNVISDESWHCPDRQACRVYQIDDPDFQSAFFLTKFYYSTKVLTTEFNSGALSDSQAWENTPTGRDYEQFNALLYAADLVIPLVSLRQTSHWTPSAQRPGGYFFYWSRWVFAFLGWSLSAIGAAAITGLIRRD